MALVLCLDDAMKVLLQHDFIAEGYIDEDGGAEVVRNELEQICYPCLPGKDNEDCETVYRREKVINGLEICVNRIPGKYNCNECPYEIDGNYCEINLTKDAITLLKEQEEEIRQLKLALDIVKGTCKGISVEGR